MDERFVWIEPGSHPDGSTNFDIDDAECRVFDLADVEALAIARETDAA